jgi:DNA-binding transcriptional ArsR family regulator
MNDLVRIGRALGDETRLAVLQVLGSDGTTATIIAERLGLSRSTAIYHLDILVDAGLAERVETESRARVYRWPAERLVLVRMSGDRTDATVLEEIFGTQG